MRGKQTNSSLLRGLHVTGDAITALFASIGQAALIALLLGALLFCVLIWAVADFWQWSRILNFMDGDTPIPLSNWLFFSTMGNYVLVVIIALMLVKWGRDLKSAKDFWYKQGQEQASGFVNGMQENIKLTENTIRSTISVLRQRDDPPMLEGQQIEPEYLPEANYKVIE